MAKMTRIVKKMRSKNKKKHSSKKRLYISLIIAIVLIFSTGMFLKSVVKEESDLKFIDMPEQEGAQRYDGDTYKKGAIVITNENLGDNHLYYFKIQNGFSETKECWVNIEIKVGQNFEELVKSNKEYIGYINPGQSIPVNISLGELPEGLSLIDPIPECKSVS